MEVKFEISIVCMDDDCNNSVKYIDITTCNTIMEAKKAVARATKDLKAGKYDKELKHTKYVYINALPYNMDGDCMIGIAWDYASKYYQNTKNGWCIKH